MYASDTIYSDKDLTQLDEVLARPTQFHSGVYYLLDEADKQGQCDYFNCCVLPTLILLHRICPNVYRRSVLRIWRCKEQAHRAGHAKHTVHINFTDDSCGARSRPGGNYRRREEYIRIR